MSTNINLTKLLSGLFTAMIEAWETGKHGEIYYAGQSHGCYSGNSTNHLVISFKLSSGKKALAIKNKSKRKAKVK